MNKLSGALLMVMGILLQVYNSFFAVQNITKGAIMQLEDSDVLYGIGANISTANIQITMSAITLILVVSGLYLYIKPKKGN